MENSRHTIQSGLSQEYLKHKDKIDEAVTRVLASGRYILGPELEKFEARFAKHTGYKYCVGVGNGYDGLLLSLWAIGDCDEVTIINELHPATTNACRAYGADITYKTDPAIPTYIEAYDRRIRDACRVAHKFYKEGSDLTVFSFHPLKVLHCYGDGGAVVTDDARYYKRLLQLRNHGRLGKTDTYLFGMNSRLDEIQAAILNVMMDVICV